MEKAFTVAVVCAGVAAIDSAQYALSRGKPVVLAVACTVAAAMWSRDYSDTARPFGENDGVRA